MAEFLSDDQIHALLLEEKLLPADFRRRMKLKPKRGHKESELDVVGVSGSAFRLLIRQSLFNPLDFSVILGFCVPGSNQIVRLRRYNGKSHEHTNPIEQQTFYDFHIHKATERYQRSGSREDTYAEVTDRFVDVEQAIDCLLQDCGFVTPDDPQQSLFAFGGSR